MSKNNKDKLKRWNLTEMLEIGRRLFAKIHHRKKSANHNHEIHFLAREIHDWLPHGLGTIINGSYTPRHLRRYYFADAATRGCRKGCLHSPVVGDLLYY